MAYNNSVKRSIYVDGFPSLAAFIASDLDRSTLIFKRFSRLAARNLLVIQSELAELESKLDSYDRDDHQSRETMQSLRNWADYKSREKDNPDRMRTLSQIRSTMKEYREALLFESTLASIATPDRRTFEAFRLSFFHGHQDDPQSFPMLGGTSSSLYDDMDDLVALHDSADIDSLTIFVKDHFGFFFKDVVPQDGGSKVPIVGYVSGRRVAAFVAYLSMILAVILLFGAIFVLYNVKSNDTKVGLVALFTILFTASVGLLTNAKRSEVYGATAAYAAVLVVFISGNVGGQGP